MVIWEEGTQKIAKGSRQQLEIVKWSREQEKSSVSKGGFKGSREQKDMKNEQQKWLKQSKGRKQKGAGSIR